MLEAKLSREQKAQADLEDEVKFVKSKLDHTIYDMLYLILARRNSAVLLTMDKKLKSVALKSGVEVSLELQIILIEKPAFAAVSGLSTKGSAIPSVLYTGVVSFNLYWAR